jgi:hypothetical protein
VAYTNRPDWAIQVAFNADPNDASAVPVWVDLTTMVMAAGQISRGRQYELAQSQAAQPVVLFRDPNEYLNPDNTSSPYYPNVQPYRALLWQGMWPNGGAGNLLNSGTWRIPVDPTFESTTAGTTPSYITAVGGSTAVVVNAQT